MKKILIGFITIGLTALVGCKKDNAASYDGNYDAELVWALGQKYPVTMSITESGGDLSINVIVEEEDVDQINSTFEAVDNGNDYFEVTPCTNCWDDGASIKSGSVRKVDDKVSIELQLRYKEDDFEMDLGCEIHEK